MKKLYLLLLVFVAACGAGAAELYEHDITPPGVLVVGYAQVGAESAWRMANTSSFMEAFADNPRFDFRFVDSHNNPRLQQIAVYDFIVQEVDYIILAPIEESGWDEILAEARDAGIPVILSDRTIDTEDETLFVTWVGGDFLQEGLDAIEWLKNYVASIGRENELLNVFHMQGTIGSTAQLRRTEGILQGIENSNFVIVEQASGDFTIAKGQEVMAEWLSMYSYTEIDILIAENDEMAIGAIRAMQAAGINPGVDIIIVSFDAGRRAVQAVADGLINLSVESNPLHGNRVREIIELLEAGETLQKREYVHTGRLFDITNAADEIENRF